MSMEQSYYQDCLERWWNDAEDDEGPVQVGDVVMVKEAEDLVIILTATKEAPLVDGMRILAHAKPSWYDAVAVLASHKDLGGVPVVWENSDDGYWDDTRGHVAHYTELEDVTALVPCTED